jgi:hypothetical protein
VKGPSTVFSAEAEEQEKRMRVMISSCLAAGLLLASCAQDRAWNPATSSAGAGTSGGSAGNGSSAGGAAVTTGGSSAVSTWTNVGGTDNGSLLGPNAVPFDAAVFGGSGGTGNEGGAGGEGPPGDGNSAISTIKGDISGTATFTQSGIDVTVVFDLTGCPDGDHVVRIHDGYACDNESTQGVIWDGARGEIGTINCSGNAGALTYTRPGSDSATNWTVGDHNLATDLSAYVLVFTNPGDDATRIACGNFF